MAIDGATLSVASDGRSWVIDADRARVAVISPQTTWTSLAADVNGAIFVSGGPAEWQGPGQGLSVIQVAANSRGGLPGRAVVLALSGAPLYRTDRLGTVELVMQAGRVRSRSE